MIGRAYIYGLGAGGQAGVAHAIEIIRNELDVTMALTGVNNIAEIDRQRDRKLTELVVGRMEPLSPPQSRRMFATNL